MRRLRVVCRLLASAVSYAPSARADRQTHRVAALISPESDTGRDSASFSAFAGGVRSPLSSIMGARGVETEARLKEALGASI
jgi:hypothetical protein